MQSRLIADGTLKLFQFRIDISIIGPISAKVQINLTSFIISEKNLPIKPKIGY